MTMTVIGLFDTVTQAHRAVSDLQAQGFSRDDISLVANDAGQDYERELGAAGSGATAGATSGGLLGGIAGLLAGLGALAIPGIGPVIAAGPLAGVLGGAALGAATGGLVGALNHMGIPDKEARMYAEGIRRGGALVTVRTEDDQAQPAAEIMAGDGALDIDETSTRWSQAGTSGFPPAALPRDHEQIVRERNQAPTPPLNLARESESRTIGSEGETVLPVVEEELQVGKRQVEGGGVRVSTRITERPVEQSV